MSDRVRMEGERPGSNNRVRESLVVVVFALVGWAICGAIMAIGMQLMSLDMALLVHAIGAPLVFATLSWLYFTRFHYTTPLQTAIAFVTVVVLMDFFVVSLIINRNLEMFASIMGTWLVFALIFISTYLTGRFIEGQRSVAF